MENEQPKASIGHCRRLARKVLNDAAVKSAPVMITAVVDSLRSSYDISVYAWNFDESISGIQVAENATACAIGYNEEHHVHRQRLTVAHEMGHFLLGHTRESDPTKFKPTEVQEQEAYEFAGELLMPLSFLKKEIEKGYANIDTLARTFLVSSEAMSVRLIRTRLLNKL